MVFRLEPIGHRGRLGRGLDLGDSRGDHLRLPVITNSPPGPSGPPDSTGAVRRPLDTSAKPVAP